MKDWFPANSDGRPGFELEPPEDAPICCPVCGHEFGWDEEIFLRGREVVGCMECLVRKDAAEWAEERKVV